MARIQEARGDVDGADQLLREAERLYVGDFFPNVRPIPAMRARLWLTQGRLDEAEGLAPARASSDRDEDGYLREFEQLTLARIYIARYRERRDPERLAAAWGLLSRVGEGAEAGRRNGSVIEIVLLQALVRYASGDLPDALAHLEHALALAEPEGYVRTFVDEGAPMRDLLRHAVAAGTGGAYARRLLTAFEPRAQADTLAPANGAGLAEPLTAREVEILRLVAAGMQNQEIADHLVISLATVKRHIANTYGKLDVTHRTAAIARANELHLL